MVTTVTLNPCIDLSVRVPALVTGGLNLVTDTRVDVSGKGVNVGIVLRELGHPTLCAGISFDGNGVLLDNLLESHGIAGRFVAAHGSIRTNIKVYDDSKAEMTEINSPGPVVEPYYVERLLEELEDWAARSEIVVFSGRVPNGGYEDIYRRCLQRIKKHKVKTIVDAEGKPLREALRQKPYLIKPNLYELETAFRQKLSSKGEIVGFCREKLIAGGVRVVCVSMGGEGAVILDEEAAFYAPPLKLEVKGFTGAGDSMTAGICKAIREERGIDDMLRFGVAAASASLLREGTLLCRRRDFDRLLPQVTIEALP